MCCFIKDYENENLKKLLEERRAINILTSTGSASLARFYAEQKDQDQDGIFVAINVCDSAAR